MRFFIVDDDEAIRYMLAELIEDCDLGRVVGEADSGEAVDAALLAAKEVDILIIDLLMPRRDGMQTVETLRGAFGGKIVMLSQVENKELVGRAYARGVDYYITKPINRNEVTGVLRAVSEHIRLRRFACHIESSLSAALRPEQGILPQAAPQDAQRSVVEAGRFFLSELGIAGEMGCRDLLAVLEALGVPGPHASDEKFPLLKEIFDRIAADRASSGSEDEIRKECKALEQRLRRAIFQAMVNLASIGVVDYAHPKFEDYAATFFDFSEIRKIMALLEKEEKPQMSQARINLKKFIRVFWSEARKKASL